MMYLRGGFVRRSRKIVLGWGLKGPQSWLALLVGGWLGVGGAGLADSFDDWLQNEEKIAVENLLDATGKEVDGRPTFVASAAANEPSYDFHWVRDAAAAMRSILHLYQVSQTPDEKEKYFQIFYEYMNFSKRIQEAPNPSGGVGEPKFYPDGSPFTGPWARPQSDGPASRAIVLLSWAQVLMGEGHFDLVRSRLYDSKLPTRSVIKTDLEYIANNWRTPCYDLWEETKGDHFYTFMMERRALLDGAALAVRLGDPEAASWYTLQARAIEAELSQFWDSERKILIPVRHQSAGPSMRESGLDSSVILGVILGKTNDGFLEFSDEKVVLTVLALEQKFKELYPINRENQIPGLSIGRYPEDQYDGYTSYGTGNPWVPMTATFAQFYHRLATEISRHGAVTITDQSKPFFDALLTGQGYSTLSPRSYVIGGPGFDDILKALRKKADSYLKRIAYHTGPDGNLSEQMHRDTGFMQGAQHLAASYATFLWASWARQGAFPTPELPGNP